ncbi:hypothetical protein [Corallococcus aberystwythensis]|uniref:hypothetical protein n=1 Tax=Corallococcus aberystwythensis TaxID=2316722 RepID=UPI0011C43EA8|nr:hypothetical protein [Corallococcus aberystwythensis]
MNETPSNNPSTEESSSPKSSTPKPTEAKTLAWIIEALEELDPPTRQRILHTVSVFYSTIDHPSHIPSPTFVPQATRHHQASAQPPVAPFTEDRTPSPKDFLLNKKPVTDIERVTCLAYYITHFRDTPHFKTLDLSKLNTEAAQIKLSNAAHAVDNASKAGLLVAAVRGTKQISAMGELYVQALPDREAARNATTHFRAKRRGRKSSSTNERNE